MRARARSPSPDSGAARSSGRGSRPGGGCSSPTPSCARGRCGRTCRCASMSRRDGDRYELTVTNATSTSRGRVPGQRGLREAARGAARPDAPRLAGAPAAATCLRDDQRRGLASGAGKTRIAAPLRVEGGLRFPSAPSRRAARRSPGAPSRFSFVLGDAQPLTRRVEVTRRRRAAAAARGAAATTSSAA